MLNQLEYCERRFYLMHVLGEMEVNVHVLEGTLRHAQTHDAGKEREGETIMHRWVYVWSDALAGLSLMLFFPSWEMLASIVAGILIWSVALLILRYGRSAGLRLWTVASTRAAGTQAAGIGAYALAALIFGAMGCF